MCGGYTTHSHDVPAVTRNTVAEPVSTKQSRRINAQELAKQVATLVQNSGKVTRTDSLQGVALTEYTLRRGETRAIVQTANNPFGESATFVQVKRGRKTLLTGNGIGLGAGAQYTDAQFTPGSWTKPFRLVDLSATVPSSQG